MIYYTKHAKKRMIQRNINREQVENCIKNYQVVHTDLKGKTRYIFSYSNGKNVKVVVEVKSPQYLKVITVED